MIILFFNGIVFQIISLTIGIYVIIEIINSVMLGIILIGTANTLISCVWNVTKNSDNFTGNLAKLYTKQSYLKNLVEFLYDENRVQEIDDRDKLEDFIQSIDSIEFKNVSFKYKEELPYVLKNINFKIEKDEKVALVGKNGSGKSTIIKLILGIYKNFEGEILINNKSIDLLEKDTYYKHIGVIFQNFTRYETRLIEFLKLSNFEISNEEINETIKLFQKQGLLKFLLNKNLSSIQLGQKFDKGIDLSGGEWQQLVFCRTLLNRNYSLLILDEPNSGLDVFSEKSMYKILDAHSLNHINILVTHRLSIIDSNVYRAIYLENGTILEDDKVSELLKNDSAYKNMYINSNKYGGIQ